MCVRACVEAELRMMGWIEDYMKDPKDSGLRSTSHLYSTLKGRNYFAESKEFQ